MGTSLARVRAREFSLQFFPDLSPVELSVALQDATAAAESHAARKHSQSDPVHIALSFGTSPSPRRIVGPVVPRKVV
jgi:hypothetical protein